MNETPREDLRRVTGELMECAAELDEQESTLASPLGRVGDAMEYGGLVLLPVLFCLDHPWHAFGLATAYLFIHEMVARVDAGSRALWILNVLAHLVLAVNVGLAVWLVFEHLVPGGLS